MITIDDIRDSRKSGIGYWGSPIDGYECLEAEAHVDFLLAALERQQAVVAAIAQYAPDDGTSYAQDFDYVQGIARAALAADGSAQGGG